LSTLAQLWASFETGDTKAAVALADLYMRGDGVPANCEQARVLLFVASKENNAEATKKLQDLDEAGCPAP
jgi:TPR repeat protein